MQLESHSRRVTFPHLHPQQTEHLHVIPHCILTGAERQWDGIPQVPAQTLQTPKQCVTDAKISITYFNQLINTSVLSSS